MNVRSIPSARTLLTGLGAILLVVSASCSDDHSLTDPLVPPVAKALLSPSTPFVNSLADPGTGGCDLTECTLREAIAYAQDGATITFVPGLTGTITLGSPLQIHSKGTLTIQGPGAGSLTIAGNGTQSVFSTAFGTTTLSDMTITGGGQADFPYDGGGIYAWAGTLHLVRTTVTGNSATGTGGGIGADWTQIYITESTISGNTAVSGGGVHVTDGALSLTESTVANNSATANGSGGGISTARGTNVTLTDCLVVNNEAAGSGGGAYLYTNLVRVERCTFAGNSANGYMSSGGALHLSGGTTDPVATVVNSTFSGNTAWRGAAIHNYGANTSINQTTITGNPSTGEVGSGLGVGALAAARPPLQVKGSIIWGNPGGDVAIDGYLIYPLTSLGYNLVGAAGENVTLSSIFNQTGDQIGITDPKLGSLQINTPGTTPTHALLAGSPAIDAGVCTDAGGEDVLTDQRGVSRPQGSGCDVGAYELTGSLEDPGFTFVLSSLDKSYGDPPFDVSGFASSSAGSTGTVNFGEAPGSVGCSVTLGGTVTLTGAATGGDLCRVTAYIASDGTYSSAGPVEQSFAIGRAALTVTAENQTITYGGTPSFGVTYDGFVGSDDASGLSGTLVYEFESSTVVPTNAGTYTITPGGLTAYDYEISFVPGTFTINKAAGTISIDNIPSEPRGGGTFTPTYATNSDGTPSVTSKTTNVCTVSAGVVTFLEDGGVCTLVASVAEGTNHLMATGDDQTFEVAPDILPPDEAIPELITASEDAGLSRGTVNKLRDALKHWLAGRTTAAVSTLQDYIEDVQDLAGKKLTAEDAEELIAAAQQIIDTILAGL